MHVAPREPSVGTPSGCVVRTGRHAGTGSITRQTASCFKIILTLHSSGESARKLCKKTRSLPVLRGEPSQVGVRGCEQNTVPFALNAPNPSPTSASPFPLPPPLPLRIIFPDPHAAGPGPLGECRSAKVPGPFAW